MNLKINMTPELLAHMGERRDYYKANYPAMTQQERIDLVREDMITEHFRLQGETVFVVTE